MKKTTLCYLEHNDCYLMMLRNKKNHDQSEGKWLGIGGKFLEGETSEECLRREVGEETGFTLDNLHFHGVVHFLSDTWEDEDMYLYTSRDFSWPERNLSDMSVKAKQDPYGTQQIPCEDSNDGTRAKACLQKPNNGIENRSSVTLSSLTNEPPTPDCDEGTLRWIPKSKVLDLNLWQGDHLFLERLIAGEDFGELTVRYEGDTLVASL